MKITKKQLRRIIREALNRRALNENHPFDASIIDAVDIGMYSNSDAVDKVRGYLLSNDEMDLVDEINMMAQYGDDDIYKVLAMIPREIKDKLPIG